MIERCSKCHAGFNLINGAKLWLCPLCGKYGEVKSLVRDDRNQPRYVHSSTEYGLVIV